MKNTFYTAVLVLISGFAIGQGLNLETSIYPTLVQPQHKLAFPYGSISIQHTITKNANHLLGIGFRSTTYGNDAYVEYRYHQNFYASERIKLDWEAGLKIGKPLFYNLHTFSLNPGAALLLNIPKFKRATFILGLSYFTAPQIDQFNRQSSFFEGILGFRISIGKKG